MSSRGAIVIVIVVAFCLIASACTSRPTSEVLNPVPVKAASSSKPVKLMVATTRERGGADEQAFGPERAKSTNYAYLAVSIPPQHKVGHIEWPTALPGDPSQHFVATERAKLSRDEFVARLAPGSVRKGEPKSSVLVFVHGYNTLYEEAVFRFAQIVHDSAFSGTAVLFAWPSRGKAPLYLADRDASTYSRDYLERLLQEIAAHPGVGEINILAHSMGTWLTVETLRQAKLGGRLELNGKLGDVILASPDIDLGVFRTQLDVIGPLRRPMTVMVSGDDKALALSTMLSGGVVRVGQISATDPDIVAGAQRYNVRVVDLTRVGDDVSSNHHGKFAESSAVIRAIGRGLESPDKPATPGVITALTNVGSSLVQVPAALIGVPQQ